MLRVIDKQKISDNREKISLYKTSEDINLEEINTKLKELSYLYKTANSEKINNLNNELNEKIKKINEIHNNYILIMNKTINKYKETDEAVKTILSEINTDIDVR